MRDWLKRLGVTTLYIAPGSPWENGYVESLIDKLRDELLNGEIFYTLREAQVLIQRWRWEYNHIRPHSSLGHSTRNTNYERCTNITSGTNNGGGSYQANRKYHDLPITNYQLLFTNYW